MRGLAGFRVMPRGSAPSVWGPHRVPEPHLVLHLDGRGKRRRSTEVRLPGQTWAWKGSPVPSLTAVGRTLVNVAPRATEDSGEWGQLSAKEEGESGFWWTPGSRPDPCNRTPGRRELTESPGLGDFYGVSQHEAASGVVSWAHIARRALGIRRLILTLFFEIGSRSYYLIS